MQDKFGVRSIMDNNDELMGAVYLQVTTLIAVYADSGRLLR
ncbi:unnamed protein product [Brassica napus]|uniref:(rape) hypothetical protein n=1 Tax=Brassica napus TaxID=3708 RepID=A0A816X8N8_BRANA|nr:unnamed protein product [Brassica napus]